MGTIMANETTLTPPRAAGRNDHPVLEQPLTVLAPPGLVSVLLPCCGQLEYTKLCVPSLLRHSRKPFELIFLDIGSLDGTAEYLAGVPAAPAVRVEAGRTATHPGH